MVWAAVNVAGGGLVVYGAVIGGILGTLAFIHRYKLPSLAMFDLAIPSLMLGMGLGRLGCLMNGCCFGSLCSLPWAVTFPPGSPPHIYQFQHGQLALQGIKVYGWPGTLRVDHGRGARFGGGQGRSGRAAAGASRGNGETRGSAAALDRRRRHSPRSTRSTTFILDLLAAGKPARDDLSAHRRGPAGDPDSRQQRRTGILNAVPCGRIACRGRRG